MLAVEQPTLGMMETDWAENRADCRRTSCRARSARSSTSSATRYKRDKFRTRIERGTEPGTVEIYISHRGVGAGADDDDRQPLAGGVRLGGDAAQSRARGRNADAADGAASARPSRPRDGGGAGRDGRAGPERARLEKDADGSYQLVVDDRFDRAWRRVGLALDRIGFTVVDRDRSQGRVLRPLCRSRHRRRQEGQGLPRQAHVLEDRRPSKPEQYRIMVAEATPRSVVTVQDPNGAPDKTRDRARRSSRCSRTSSSSGAARMRFASIGSGSEGNGLVVEAGGTRVLIDCGFGVRDTAARLARLGARARRRSTRSSSRTSTPTTSAACRRSRRATAFRSGSRSARWPRCRRALRRHAARLRLRQPRPVRDRRPRGRAVPGAARRARAGAVRRHRRRAAARRADRPRHVDAARRGEPVRLRRAGARMQPRSRHAGERRLSVSAEAAHRRAPRPPAQRGRGGAAGRARHLAGCSTSSPRTCRKQNNTPELARAALAAALGCRAGLDRHRRPGAKASPGARSRDRANRRTGMEKRDELYKGKAKTVYATDDPHHLVMHYRDDVSAFDGVKLAKLDAEGRDQQQDQRLRDGQARRGGRADAFRPRAERARVAGEGDEDDPGRVRRAQRLRGLDGQALRHRRRARGWPSRSSSSSSRATRCTIRCATTTTSACSAGRAPRRSRR